MTDLSDPNQPSNRPLAPVTPRWQRRRLGIALALGLTAALGWSAWHYRNRVPTVPSNTGAVPSRGLR